MTTHTDLIARLRVIANAIADGNYSELTMRIPAEPDRDADIVVMRSALALESLEQQVAALTKELDKAEALRQAAYDVSVKHGESLAASQSREAKMREALVDYDNQASEYDGRTSKELGDRIKSLIALPTDDSALMERLKEERERCAEFCEAYDKYDYAVTGRKTLADAIRGLA